MDVWTRLWDGQIVCSRRESRLAFQATRNLKNQVGLSKCDWRQAKAVLNTAGNPAPIFRHEHR